MREESSIQKGFGWGCGLYLGLTAAALVVSAVPFFVCCGGLGGLGILGHAIRTVPSAEQTRHVANHRPTRPTQPTQREIVRPIRTAPLMSDPEAEAKAEAERQRLETERLKREEAERKEAEEKTAKEKADKEESAAQALLKAGKNFEKQMDLDLAIGRYRRVIDLYPNTKAAEEARERLKALKK